MTTADLRPTRQVTVKEAIASVVGYLGRESLNLAVSYVNGVVTDGALDDLRVGLDGIVGHLGGLADAVRQGETHVTWFADEL